jgi:hypothetical protein
MHRPTNASLDLRRAYDRQSRRRRPWTKPSSQQTQCSVRTHTSLGAATRKAVRHDMDSLDEAAVTLHVPNDAAFLRTIRLVVASVAADMQYDFDEIEDLRIVADELAYMAMTVSVPGGLIRVVLKIGAQTLELSASGIAKDVMNVAPLDPMSVRLISELVNRMTTRIIDDRCEISLTCFPPSKSDR